MSFLSELWAKITGKRAAVSNFNVTISVMNRTTVLEDIQVAAGCNALQIQINRDFAPIWGIGANIVCVGKNKKPGVGTWQMVLLDNSDQAGALGYHETTAAGLPMGKVFVKTATENNVPWSVTLSHEVLETLVDSRVDLTVFNQTSDTQGVLYAYEVCDCVEDPSLAYKVNGMFMSDFATPNWFILGSRAPYDFLRYVHSPLTVLQGGYIGVLRISESSGWQEATGDLVNKPVIKPASSPDNSRMVKRMMKRSDWKSSVE